MAKLSTAQPAWLGSCGEVVMMEGGKMRARNFKFTKYTNPRVASCAGVRGSLVLPGVGVARVQVGQDRKQELGVLHVATDSF